jgi:hypothetical protein
VAGAPDVAGVPDVVDVVDVVDVSNVTGVSDVSDVPDVKGVPDVWIIRAEKPCKEGQRIIWTADETEEMAPAVFFALHGRTLLRAIAK